MTAFLRLITLGLLLSAAAALATAANADALPGAAPAAAAPAPVVTDPGYHLSAGDTVALSIFGEPDLASTQTLGRSGDVRLAFIGEIVLAGKTIREAEHAVEETYRNRNFLIHPVVTIVVTAYFPREISVLGAVRAPGTIVFPRDSVSLDIVEVITRVGGFLPIARTDNVTVTRRLPDGKETVLTVNLDNVITGRRQPGRERADFLIYPGDRIWIPERLF